MEKIDIKDFSKKFVTGLNFLTKTHNFTLTKFQEKSTKKDNTIIQKIIYTNADLKRIIEFVLIAEDYKTHMFCRIAETYVKKLSDNGSYPNYNDFEKCYTLNDLEELIGEKFRHPEVYKNPETYIERVKHLLNQLQKIITSNYWPSISEIAELQQKRTGFVSIGRPIVPYINEIKKELVELTDNGYQIVFDETEIPPYEQSYMGPSIRYYNPSKKTTIDITFQTRDQEFYVSSNKDKNYFYGRSTKQDYINLKKRILKQ